MKNNDNKEPKETDDSKRKSGLFWDLFLTGGWFSFGEDWKKSKNPFQTMMMFLIPILVAGILVVLGILASNIFN